MRTRGGETGSKGSLRRVSVFVDHEGHRKPSWPRPRTFASRGVTGLSTLPRPADYDHARAPGPGPMTSADFVLFTLQITVMLACAVLGGHVMRRIGQPAVLGEIIGGILLGPTSSARSPGAVESLFTWIARRQRARERPSSSACSSSCSSLGSR
jgi:hypothetical protein